MSKAMHFCIFIILLSVFMYMDYIIISFPKQQEIRINGSTTKFIEYSSPINSKKIDNNRVQTAPKAMHNDENKSATKICKNSQQANFNCFNFIFEPNVIEDKVLYQSDLLFLHESIEDIAVNYDENLDWKWPGNKHLVCATDVKKIDTKIFLINFYLHNKPVEEDLTCSSKQELIFPKTYKFIRINENNGEFEAI
jgi:hypothetical protein